MKKITLYTLCMVCLGLMSCKKDKAVVDQQPENSDQLLTKVIRTTNLSSDVFYDDFIKFQYNEAGSIVSEGYKTYVRDDLQRIVRVLNSNTVEGRPDTRVYYNEIDPMQVSYTFSPLYTGDEVRTIEIGYNGLINSSKNNFYSVGGYSKVYEYRADGRPRSCEVEYNGRIVYKLSFIYN